jgi:hypothetical protein
MTGWPSRSSLSITMLCRIEQQGLRQAREGAAAVICSNAGFPEGSLMQSLLNGPWGITRSSGVEVCKAICRVTISPLYLITVTL